MNPPHWTRPQPDVTTNAVYGPGNTFKEKEVYDWFWQFEKDLMSIAVGPLPRIMARGGDGSFHETPRIEVLNVGASDRGVGVRDSTRHLYHGVFLQQSFSIEKSIFHNLSHGNANRSVTRRFLESNGKEGTAGNGEWVTQSTENTNVAAVIVEPDTDVEVEIQRRQGWEGGGVDVWVEGFGV
ncbi:hypothetical protein G7Y89_g11836 [Cudoniella acicularis]|uniref:Uncharacterized protein n=1 Tax=Cudoniella acicularis TaxID=354080 RepID=A0A8H4RBM6_9HELO|nr:hypothetical protein G7Y89_g11836 [Cudoniella acicularis]